MNLIKEPNEFKSLDNCVFCEAPTRYWFNGETPVCKRCGNERTEIDLKTKFLNFTEEEKGYTNFIINTKNIKDNIGGKICFVDKRDYDKYRGYFKVRHGTIHSKYYSTLFLNDGNDSIDIRDI